jgi:hypothetical protein
LVTLNVSPVLSPEGQEFDIDLDLVAGNLMLIAGCMNLADTRSTRQVAQTIALEDAVDARIRDFDAMVACQIPNDADRSEVVSLTQMQHLFDDLRSCAVGRVLRPVLRLTNPSSPCRS